MKVVFLLLLALTSIGYIVAQEEKSAFVGTWTDDFFGGQSFSICQVGNKIFGAFSIGFFEGQLEADRITASGNIYFAGNTGEGNQGEFRISYFQPSSSEQQNFVGWIHLNDGESIDWRSDRISSESPSLQDSCWARDSSFDATIQGYYTSDNGDELWVCYGDDGFGYEFNLNDNVYSRGPTLEYLKAGRGQWWSEQNYGGAIFSLVDSDTLFLSTHTQDKHEVIENGCQQGFATCSVERFRRRGDAPPAACRRNDQLSNWEGYYTFTPQNGMLRMRRIGTHVYGSWTYGILEGQVNADSTVLTGSFYTANWDSGDIDKVKYFGSFIVNLNPDGSGFDGRWYTNLRGKCKNGDSCVTEWTESHIEVPHEVSSFDVFQISPNHFSRDGLNNVDGSYTAEYNPNVHYFLCRNRKRKYKRNDDKENPIKLDSEGRQRVTGTYTDFGTGGVKGAIQTELEFDGFESFAPENATMNGVWTDDEGFGTLIARKVTESVLYEFWFVGRNPELAWCDFENESNCGQVQYDYVEEASWEQCTYAQRRVNRESAVNFDLDLEREQRTIDPDQDEDNNASTVFISLLSVLFAVFCFFF